MLKPEYAENLVVAIQDSNTFNWYILERDFCFLDYEKLVLAYRRRGYDVPHYKELRFGITVVDAQTKQRFLDNIQQFKISTEKLRTMLQSETDDRLAYNPTVFIDFDNQVFLSSYPEPSSMEAHVPDGWVGRYCDLYPVIPEQYRYWINSTGKNLIK